MEVLIINGYQPAQILSRELEEKRSDCVARTIQVLRDKAATVGFAESCTGGLLSSYFAAVPGVSIVFAGSIVSYANHVKVDVLGVQNATLENFGAVSAECAKEMSEGVLSLLKVGYAVAITGIAGPDGGSAKKPVGTVYVAVSGTDHAGSVSTVVFRHDFGAQNKREVIQAASAQAALENLRYFISQQKMNLNQK